MQKLLDFMDRGPVVLQPTQRKAPLEQKVFDRFAIIVAAVSFGLPSLMLMGVFWGESCFRVSLSHFYYAQFLGPIFVGMLFFVGGFLIAYQGDLYWLETFGSTVAGILAILVAVLPTLNSGCQEPLFLSRAFVEISAPNGQTGPNIVVPTTLEQQNLFQLFSADSAWATFAPSDDLHLIAAGALFVYMGMFCLISLRRVLPEHHGIGPAMIKSKRRRNRLYFCCGATILLCVGFLASYETIGISNVWLDSWKGFFFAEMLALWAFGLAWSIKGRIIPWLNDPKVRSHNQ